MNVPLCAPDYSCVSKRARTVKVTYRKPAKGKITDLVIDSTGLRRYRQGWRKQLEQGSVLCSKRYRGRCEWLIKDDEMLWRFMNDDDIPLTNNEAERALRGYVLWRKGSYGVCSHRGELFRQRILSLVETAKRLGRCPQEWLRAIVRACIEKTDYPIPSELCASSPCR